ncbi:hypothetical protein CY35_05G077800 [Sphagnum magellanicum]|nr:hypothetical protein CY35_05G077800 [Sphagnum magellanicum]
MSGKRSSKYVKDNDVRYGLKVAHHDPKSSKEKVGSKCKAATTVQGWSHPFRYDNIENHLRNQHSGQWALYQALESFSERTSLFDDVPVAFKNSIKAHFSSLFLGIEQQIVYDIEKDIVDTIVKERALSLFKCVELEDDAVIYSYSVTIPKTKTTLFRLDVRYVSCKTSFRMAFQLIDCTYDQITNLLHHSWAFSLAFDSATHQSTSFLDLRFQVFIPNYHSIVNLHRCALPMFDRHTGDIMSTMVSKFLTVFCPDWTIRFLGLTFNGARNMTRRVAGNLIAEMQTTCPRVVNHWLSTEKVISWLKIHRPQLLAHIKSKQPDSAPPRLWWVALLSMHHFTTRAADIFRSIQGLTTLVLQQQNAMDNLIASFIDDVGVTGLLTAESIANIDPSTHVISGRYAVALSIDEGNQNDLQHDIALIYVIAYDQIHEIYAYRDRNNNAMADLGSIPPVLPHELVELSVADFIRKIRQHIDLITDEHKALIHAHRCEPMLKDGIDSLSSNSSFKDGWSLLGAQFPSLLEYCGVVATLFPGTSTIESDFSILRWENDLFRKRLSNFGLKGVMQAKQFLFIEQFQH